MYDLKKYDLINFEFPGGTFVSQPFLLTPMVRIHDTCVTFQSTIPPNSKYHTAFMVSGTFRHKTRSVPWGVHGLQVLYFTHMLAHVTSYAPIIRSYNLVLLGRHTVLVLAAKRVDVLKTMF